MIIQDVWSDNGDLREDEEQSKAWQRASWNWIDGSIASCLFCKCG